VVESEVFSISDGTEKLVSKATLTMTAVPAENIQAAS
jgi:hypothetical protein